MSIEHDGAKIGRLHELIWCPAVWRVPDLRRRKKRKGFALGVEYEVVGVNLVATSC